MTLPGRICISAIFVCGENYTVLIHGDRLAMCDSNP